MAGRPRQFDRDEVLGKALRLFWKQGYEATGVAQITTTLGIGRQSLYGTFGDKRALFIETLKRYADAEQRWLENTLFAPGSPLENLHAVLDHWQEQAGRDQYRGCFIAKSSAELARRDAPIARLLAAFMERTIATFKRALDQCIAAGELPADSDSRALAKTLLNTAQGLSCAGQVDTLFAKDVVAQTRRLLR